jgi:hypothetical protein
MTPLRIAAISAAVAVAGCSAASSFEDLVHLAAGLELPVLLPLSVDGVTLVATLASVALSKAKRRSVRYYGPVVILCSLAASTIGNSLAAMHATVTPELLAVVGGVAPVAAAVSGHLVMLLVTAQAAQAAKRTAPVAHTVAETAAAKPAGSREAVIAWARAYKAEHSEFPSGPAIAERLGRDRRTGSRLRAQLIAGTA